MIRMIEEVGVLLSQTIDKICFDCVFILIMKQYG